MQIPNGIAPKDLQALALHDCVANRNLSPQKRHDHTICTADECLCSFAGFICSGCCTSRLPIAKSFGSSCPPEMTGLDSPSSSSCRELMHGQQLDCSSSCTTDTIQPVSASTSISKVQIINSNHVPLQAPPQNKSGHCHKSPEQQLSRRPR